MDRRPSSMVRRAARQFASWRRLLRTQTFGGVAPGLEPMLPDLRTAGGEFDLPFLVVGPCWPANTAGTPRITRLRERSPVGIHGVRDRKILWRQCRLGRDEHEWKFFG